MGSIFLSHWSRLRRAGLPTTFALRAGVRQHHLLKRHPPVHCDSNHLGNCQNPSPFCQIKKSLTLPYPNDSAWYPNVIHKTKVERCRGFEHSGSSFLIEREITGSDQRGKSQKSRKIFALSPFFSLLSSIIEHNDSGPGLQFQKPGAARWRKRKQDSQRTVKPAILIGRSDESTHPAPRDKLKTQREFRVFLRFGGSIRLDFWEFHRALRDRSLQCCSVFAVCSAVGPLSRASQL